MLIKGKDLEFYTKLLNPNSLFSKIHLTKEKKRYLKQG